jgi:hypothetical protein
MKSTYSDWLRSQNLADNTIQAQLHRTGRVEDCYGDLDAHFDKDQLGGVIEELKYSTDDERRNKPNPSKIPFEGNIRNNLASYRHSVERYCKFRREISEDAEFVEAAGDSEHIPDEAAEERGQLIGLERDLQSTLRQVIDQLEPGLEIIDEGAERSVSSGFIDITATDANGAIVVIELKTGVARQRAISQILSYMGDIADEEPDAQVRGILVAGDFDKKARAAARVVPTLSLRSYRVRFDFFDGSEPQS